MSTESTTETSRNMNAPHADVEVSPDLVFALEHIGKDDTEFGKFARSLRDQLGL